jgi:hypothetical protein
VTKKNKTDRTVKGRNNSIRRFAIQQINPKNYFKKYFTRWWRQSTMGGTENCTSALYPNCNETKLRKRPKNYYPNEIRKWTPTNNFFPYPVPKDSISSIGFHHFIVQIFRMNLSQRNAHHFSFFFTPTQQRFPTNIRSFRRKETTKILVGLI